VVRAVEEVAGEDTLFEGVASTVQDAVEESQPEESGGPGVLGAAALAGAAAAGVDWALDGKPEATEEMVGGAVIADTAGEWAPEAMDEETAAEEPAKEFWGKYNRPIIDIEGIGYAYTARLAEAGITTTQGLLQQCATRKGREDLADKTGISGKLILEWANHADMMRIQGIGPQWSDLLEMVGVNTVRELALRNPENLHQKLIEVNNEKSLVRKLPTSNQVEDWVEQAKELPRILTY
jgi:predicted flap endonuclease-1-like 5' DNA nuclease